MSDPEAILARLAEDPQRTPVDLAETLRSRGEHLGALRLLEAYVRSGSRENALDEVLFSMAQLLEEEGDTRDLRRAHTLYRRVVDEHPLSLYYGASRQRAEYLERHFFLIR